MALYLIVPLGALVLELARHPAGFGTPGLVPALVVSCVTASCTTVICALLGVPLGYCLANRHGRIARLVGAAVLLPLALPPLMAGILLVSVVGPDTAVGQLFGGRLTDSMAGIVLAQLFVAAPFTIVAARSGFAAVDPALVDVSATLGLGSWQRFLRISLPIAAKAIGAGLLLTWLRAFGEFGATVIVAYHPYSLPVFTYVRFAGFGLWQAIAPTVLALAAAVVVLALTRLRVPRPTRPRPEVPPVAPGAGRPAPPIAFRLDHRLGSFHLRIGHTASSPHLAILGPSGAGKTTTLRCLAGLTGPDSGEVRIGERILSGLPCEVRHIGYVPQEPTLLPNRSAWQQVTLGPDVDPGVASFWIHRLGLHGLEERFPHQLSGGQQHRVALARALAAAPELLLLDEPFAALDAPVRQRLRRELRATLRSRPIASVLVTHDAEEAALLADEVLVLDGGRLLQAGPVGDVFARPASPSVARLLGIVNIHGGRVTAPGVIDSGGVLVTTPDTTSLPVGTPVQWCIRPEALRVSFAPDGSPAGLRAVVLDAVDLGTATELRIDVSRGPDLVLRTPDRIRAAPGTPCTVEIPPDHVHAWPAEGEDADDADDARIAPLVSSTPGTNDVARAPL